MYYTVSLIYRYRYVENDLDAITMESGMLCFVQVILICDSPILHTRVADCWRLQHQSSIVHHAQKSSDSIEAF